MATRFCYMVLFRILCHFGGDRRVTEGGYVTALSRHRGDLADIVSSPHGFGNVSVRHREVLARFVFVTAGFDGFRDCHRGFWRGFGPHPPTPSPTARAARGERGRSHKSGSSYFIGFSGTESPGRFTVPKHLPSPPTVKQSSGRGAGGEGLRA